MKKNNKKNERVDKLVAEIAAMPTGKPGEVLVKSSDGIITISSSVASGQPGIVGESLQAVAKGVEDGYVQNLQEMGEQVIRQTAQVGMVYLEICRYIRKNQIAPKLVSFALSQKGFHRVRISEINRVANAAEATWNEYEAKTIGFGKVLELQRASVVKAIADLSGESPAATEEGVKEMEEQQSTGRATRKVRDAVEVAEQKFNSAIYYLCSYAAQKGEEFYDSYSFTVGNGYMVTLGHIDNKKKVESIRAKIPELVAIDEAVRRNADKDESRGCADEGEND